MGTACASHDQSDALIKFLSHANPRGPPTKLYVNQHRISESLNFAPLDISSPHFFISPCAESNRAKKANHKKRLFGVPGEVLIDFVLKPVFDTANEFATGMGDVAAMMHLKRTSKTATSVSTFKEWEE